MESAALQNCKLRNNYMIKANETLLAQSLISPWWTLLLRGIAAVVLGLYIFARPGVAIATIALFYGLFLLLEGLGQGYRFFANRTGQVKRGYVLFMALVYTLAGVAVIFNPLLSTIISGVVISATIGIFAIISGVIELSSGISPLKGEKVQFDIVQFWCIILFFINAVFDSEPGNCIAVILLGETVH
jgi:uncharacterized membrane protein HdeD (DUF308 family)